MKEAIHESKEFTENRSVASLDQVIREDSHEHFFILARQGITEKHSIKTGAPGIFGKFRKAQLFPALSVNSPADPGISYPAVDQL